MSVQDSRFRQRVSPTPSCGARSHQPVQAFLPWLAVSRCPIRFGFNQTFDPSIYLLRVQSAFQPAGAFSRPGRTTVGGTELSSATEEGAIADLS